MLPYTRFIWKAHTFLKHTPVLLDSQNNILVQIVLDSLPNAFIRCYVT